ncbi:M14 family zinc carboxypeptidase [Caulobacter segnis]|uniref:M14 family zinc carboxypeptidase n=1 Tax=Caulobacter segnis TaxID=88688 RepID=UPI0024101305|nr:M14 family zinc carboxypeptidase [Caulobacter segnis]MDG2520720.1 M14 family zinc carboxypeptidase [Caulobacter segnis]
MSFKSWLRNAAPAALLAAAVLSSAPTVAAAQSSYFFPQAAAADFDAAIPTPEAFLGYPIGSHYTRHDQVVAYLRELDRLSDRVSVEEIGRTYEGRPLLAVTITSGANHGRLAELQAAHAAVSDPSAPAPDLARTPVVVGLYYGVHGNETSSGEAALLTAYYLAASRSAEVQDWLDKAVVIIDPAQNPDGRDRAANWHNAWKNNPPVSDPADKEHVEPFPMGRTNHYFTDLNRDWLAVTQKETRAKLEVFHRWLPNVQIDFHEMGSGSTYYFEPSPASMESPLLPKASYAFNKVLAKYHAKALDDLGSLYYTGENYDNFSAVYGSTYPDFHGGVGVTVEQASSRGLVQDTANGPLTFGFTIRNQVATGLASVRGAVAERQGLFNLQREFFRSATEEGRRYKHAAFVFGDPANPGLSRQTLDLLAQHKIRVHALAAPVTLDGKTFRPGSAWVVPSAQPQFRLIHSIFEPTPPTNGGVYGSTSYAVAPAYGLTVGRAKSAPSLGAVVTALPTAVGGVAGPERAYAYAVDWRDLNAPRVLSALLQQGVKVRAAFEPFTARTDGGETAFGRGTLVIPTAGQTLAEPQLRAAIDEAARSAGVVAQGLASGQSAAGIDLGSESVRPVRKPRVALVMGEGVNATEIGSTWFSLSERLAWPATKLDPAQLRRLPLGAYTSIVLAGGRYDDLGDDTVAGLRRFVQGGGSLVTFGAGSKWAVSKGLAGPAPKAAEEKAEDKAERLDFAARRDALAEKRSSGNALSADADITHPLAFGLSQRALFVNKETDVTLSPVADAFSNVVKIDAQPVVNGYLPEALRKQAAGTVWAQVARVGEGNVVLFADDPAHRKYWLNTERLLLNSLFFSNHLSPSARF